MRYIPYPYFAYPYFHPQWLVAENHIPTHVNKVLSLPKSFPPISTERLNTSALKFQEVMKQADLLVEKIVNNPGFAHELMDAAQQSNKEKVEELILSTGITIMVKTNYHPEGILIILDNSEGKDICCDLRMSLSW